MFELHSVTVNIQLVCKKEILSRNVKTREECTQTNSLFQAIDHELSEYNLEFCLYEVFALDNESGKGDNNKKLLVYFKIIRGVQSGGIYKRNVVSRGRKSRRMRYYIPR